MHSLRTALRLLPAGLVDSGFASLASFVIGLTASRILTPAELGAFAIFFAAFNFAAVVPATLVLTPAEAETVHYPSEERLRYFTKPIRLGALFAAGSTVIIGISFLVLPAGIPASTVTALGLTAAATTVLSPLQDFTRRMLHLAGKSWRAAAVSTVQVVVALGAVFGLSSFDVDAGWIPFGALTIANLVSLASGVALAATRQVTTIPAQFGLSRLLKRGRWLLAAGAVNPGVGLAAGATIGWLAGADNLGYAEAARILSQPILVACLGMSAVLGPRSMEAAARKQRERAHRITRAFALLSVASVVVLLLTIGDDFGWNPLGDFVPTAYVITGLAAFSIVSRLPECVLHPYRSELVGSRREHLLVRGELAGGIARYLSAFTAPWTLAFAMPIGFAVSGAVRAVAFRWYRADIYRSVSIMSRLYPERHTDLPGGPFDRRTKPHDGGV